MNSVKVKNKYGGSLVIIGYINIEHSKDVLCITQFGGTTVLSEISEIEDNGSFLYYCLAQKKKGVQDA